MPEAPLLLGQTGAAGLFRAVAATRELFGNPGTPRGAAAWPLAHPLAATLLWSAVLLLIFVPLSIRTYRLKGR